MDVINARLRVLFFESEREPSKDSTLVETEALSWIAEPSDAYRLKPALYSRSVLVLNLHRIPHPNEFYVCVLHLTPFLHALVGYSSIGSVGSQPIINIG
jgi:hypothetical protein